MLSMFFSLHFRPTVHLLIVGVDLCHHGKTCMLTFELIVWKQIIIYVFPIFFMFEPTNFVKGVERRIHV